MKHFHELPPFAVPQGRKISKGSEAKGLKQSSLLKGFMKSWSYTIKYNKPTYYGRMITPRNWNLTSIFEWFPVQSSIKYSKLDCTDTTIWLNIKESLSSSWAAYLPNFVFNQWSVSISTSKYIFFQYSFFHFFCLFWVLLWQY